MKDKYPLLRIDDLFDQMREAKVLSNIDLRFGYQWVRIKNEDVHKETFKARYESYEFIVVPFGFTNAPTTFICLRNNVFSWYLRKYVLVFVDDIPTYSKNEEEHVEALRLILKFLREHKWYAELRKFDFYKDMIHCSGHIILDKGISVDPERIEAIMSWSAPRKMTNVRYFMGLAGYYRRFIEGFSKVSHAITSLQKKGTKFEWTSKCEESFQQLKNLLTSAPVLKVADP